VSRPNRRKRKLIEPRLQWRFASIFLTCAALAALVQSVAQCYLLMRIADALPHDGVELKSRLLDVLGGSFLVTILLLTPVMLAVGILSTFPIVGPLYRFRVFLTQLANGERPGPCKIRKGDELQDLCELLNRATAPLRQDSTAPAQESIVEAPVHVRPPELASASRGGFTLIELLVAATVFALVAGAICSSLIASTALNRTSRETILAMEAASNTLEALKGSPLEEVFARYNASSADDPASGASPGAAFAVAGLDVSADDADDFAGEIEFPGKGGELREDDDDAELGLPRDLNGDGAVDTSDHAADYRLLPVRVVVEWTGKTGARRLELVSVLGDI
jgi:prepilin-type N-terminal cleavage/methylation domain-containing protein